MPGAKAGGYRLQSAVEEFFFYVLIKRKRVLAVPPIEKRSSREKRDISPDCFRNPSVEVPVEGSTVAVRKLCEEMVVVSL